MCTLAGMSHGWSGAPYTGPWLMLQYGGGQQFEDAAELMWRFFARTLQTPAPQGIEAQAAELIDAGVPADASH